MPRRSSPPQVCICSTQTAVRVPRKRITELVAFVTERQRAVVRLLDLAVVGKGEIADMNRRFRRRNRATDVLSFDLSGPGEAGISAQLVVCGPVAVEEARARGTGVQRELLLYVVHGLLHLTGCDDKTASGAAAMRARQEQLLEQFLDRCRKK